MTRAAVTTLLVALAALVVSAPAGGATSIEWADIEPLAPQSLLLGISVAGERLVAVGERGHVVLSEDRGRTWRQAARVPTRALLTGVCFADPRHGIAVGHDETIIVTGDGGESWTLAHRAPEAQRPLLDVWCAAGREAIAVGAYSAYYVSADAGATWTARQFQPRPAAVDARDSPLDYHLNHIAGSGARLYIAAEGGHLYRSDDSGANWSELPSPYAGSFFGLLPLGSDAVLAFGLRGHVFRSEDAGAHWRESPSGTLALLDGAVPVSGGVVIVGLSGALLMSSDAGRTWRLYQQPDRKALSGAIAVAPGTLAVVGEGGARLIPFTAP